MNAKLFDPMGAPYLCPMRKDEPLKVNSTPQELLSLLLAVPPEPKKQPRRKAPKKKLQ